MFDRKGYSVIWRQQIYKGPDIDKIMDSCREFLTGTLRPLDFYISYRGSTTTYYRTSDDLRTLAVAGIEHCGGESVNLKLQSGLKDTEIIYQALGYNFNKFKGNLEELRQIGKGPIRYEPVRLPAQPSEMMTLDDKGFVAVYLMHMSTYDLPVFCSHPGCDFAIFNPADLRRFYGRNLCPCHFPEAVRKDKGGSDAAYMKRVARLMPKEPLAIKIYPKGIFEHVCP